MGGYQNCDVAGLAKDRRASLDWTAEGGCPHIGISAHAIQSLLLTVGAVVAAAAGDYDAFDGSFADEAGLAFATVDAVLELKEAFFAVGVDVVGNGGATEGNCFAENFLDGCEQLGKLIASDGGGAAARADSGAEQRFIGINVAHAAQEFLIEESAFNGRLAATKQSEEAIEIGVQRLNAEGVKVTVYGDAQAAEAAGIVEALFPSLGKLQNGVRVLENF